MYQLEGKQLFYNEVVETSGRVIIVDMPLETKSKECLQSFTGMKLIDWQKAATIMLNMLANEMTGKVLMVFPGNGGIKVRQTIDGFDNFECAQVFAKRYWSPGRDPVARVGEILTPEFLRLDIDQIIVIDDVISSGGTMKLLLERNGWKFPKADWIGTSWFSQMPRKGFPLGKQQYRKIITAYLLKGSDALRVPINSLSALVDDEAMAENYDFRHGYHGHFKNLLREIKDKPGL